MITIWPITGMPEVRAGDDLAALIVGGLARCGLTLVDGDVLVVSSKVVSKAAGLVRRGASRAEAVTEHTVRTVARRRTAADSDSDTVIVESLAGPVMAAAGADSSNTPAGEVLLLPTDADAEARSLRAGLAGAATGARTGAVIGVVIADTAGRPWRDGVTDFALGVAGLTALEDLRGQRDTHDRPLEVTVRAIADEIAAAADLVKGKVDGVPVALVRGAGAYVTAADGPGARVILRGRDNKWWQDWFRYGHVEAVRAALATGQPAPPPGAEPLGAPVPAPSVAPETVAVRAVRALHLALASHQGQVTGVVSDATGTVELEVTSGSAYAMGAVVARLQVALWSEHLATSPAHGQGTEARFAIRELVD